MKSIIICKKSIETIEGVVVEYNGEFWGSPHDEFEGYGELCFADIHDPAFCFVPTDIVHTSSGHYGDLSKGKLVRARKTVIIETLE